MFQVGDIVKDVSVEYADCDMTGIIVGAVNIMGKSVFHVQFYGEDEAIPLYSYEIEKVS
jgi:hypothetical protein